MFVTFVTFTGLYMLLIAAVGLLLALLRIRRHRLRRIPNAEFLYDNLSSVLAYGREGAWLKLFPFMPRGLAGGKYSPIEMCSLKLTKYIRKSGEIGLELELPVGLLQANQQFGPASQKQLIAEICSRRGVSWHEVSDPPMPDARHLFHFDLRENIDAVLEILNLVLEADGAEVHMDGVGMQIAGVRRDRKVLRKKVDRQEESKIEEVRAEYLAALGPYSLAALSFGLVFSKPTWPGHTMQIGTWIYHIPTFDIFSLGVFALFLLFQQPFLWAVSGWTRVALKLALFPLRLLLLFLTLANLAPRVLIQHLFRADDPIDPIERLSPGNLLSDTADRRFFAICAAAFGVALSLTLVFRWTTAI